MTSDEKNAEWRGKVISTLESLNHSDDILWKKLEGLKASDDKIETKVIKHCMECEGRLIIMETKLENLENHRSFQNKLIIGLILTMIGGIIAIIGKIIVGG